VLESAEYEWGWYWKGFREWNVLALHNPCSPYMFSIYLATRLVLVLLTITSL
jgi:hypothetical protein